MRLVSLSLLMPVFIATALAHEFDMLNRAAEYAVETAGEVKEIDGWPSWTMIADPVGIEWKVPVNLGVEELRSITNTPAFAQWLAEKNDEVSPPTFFESGIEIPASGLFVLQSHTNAAGWAYFADDDGTLLKVKVHGSPWKSKSEIRAGVDQAKSKSRSDKAAFRAAKGQGQLQDRIEALEAAVEALMNSK